MAESRSHAGGIPTGADNMKLLTLTFAAAVVMAATGCETYDQRAARMDAKGLVRTQDGKWVPKGTRFFGSGHPWVMEDGSPAPAVFDPTVFNQAMAQNMGGNAPQPIIVTGPGSPPITTASQVGGTAVISTIGSAAPIGAPVYNRPAYGYYGY
jgi:hypothetical protein